MNTGLQVSVLPVVAPNNRTVFLQLGVNLARFDAPKPSAGPISWTIKSDSGRPTLTPQQVPPAPSTPAPSRRR